MKVLPPLRLEAPHLHTFNHSTYTFPSTRPMHSNTRLVTTVINGGQHLQVNGDYNYHTHTQQLTNNDDAAVQRKRDGEHVQ